MNDRKLTTDEIRDRVTWLKDQARKGADRLHATGTAIEASRKPTPTEELARARARADKEARRG